MNTYEFITSYYYLPDSKETLPNYNLYDIFSLLNNFKNRYPKYEINVQDKLEGNKMFMYLVIKSSEPISDKSQIIKDIDYFTGPERLFVILFPFDKPIYNSKGILISSLVYNRLLQIVNLKYEVKADNASLLLALDNQEQLYDQIADAIMNIDYKYTDEGLFVNLSKTGYFEVLYNELFRYIYEQVLVMFDKGFCFCNQLFADRFNLISYGDTGAFYQDWRINYLFKNMNMTEFLLQLQEDNSAFFIIELDDIDIYELSVYLEQTTHKFFKAGLWIKNIPDFEFLFDLFQVIIRSKRILDCEIIINQKEPGVSYKTLKETLFMVKKC